MKLSVSKFLTSAGGVVCVGVMNRLFFPSSSKPQKTGEGSGSQFSLIKQTYSGNPQ